MGYTYTASGALVCDGCGTSGAVRKRPCPDGWCSPSALCSTCQKTSPDPHTNCKEASADARRRKEREEELMRAGAWVRYSAIGRGQGESYTVEVSFRNSAGYTLTAWMAKATYRAFPLIKPATLGDFAAVGPVYDAAGHEMAAHDQD